MKTNLFIAALSLVVLAGCSSENEIDTLVSKSDNAINFGTYVGKQTKALDKGAFNEGDKFGVSAYYGDGTFEANFMSNEIISTTDGSTWTYTNTKYWPEDKHVSFVAYYPNLTTAPTITGGATEIPFTVDSDATKQVDFMWSTVQMATKSDKNGTAINGKTNDTTGAISVPFVFQHGLSRVLFKAQLGASSYAGVTINITNVTIKDINSTGTFTIPSTLVVGSWGSLSETKDYTALNSSTTISNNTATLIGNSLLMIPQDVADKTIEITYNLVYANPELTIPNTKTITLAASSKWEINKQYTYIFTISLDAVDLTATVDSFDATTADIEL
ncbi:MAG: fimbrillin family protein [Parabacteroides sp.]|nr:fimbrillin family protein [Parabacteroides sp.]